MNTISDLLPKDRPSFVISTCVFVIIILIIIHSFMQAEVSVLNYQYFELIQERKKYEQKNLILYEQIIKYSAYTTIESKAMDMGFTERSILYYVR